MTQVANFVYAGSKEPYVRTFNISAIGRYISLKDIGREFRKKKLFKQREFHVEKRGFVSFNRCLIF